MFHVSLLVKLARSLDRPPIIPIKSGKPPQSPICSAAIFGSRMSTQSSQLSWVYRPTEDDLETQVWAPAAEDDLETQVWAPAAEDDLETQVWAPAAEDETMGRGQSWSEADLSILKDAIAAREKLYSVAAKYGWNYSSTEGMARRLATGREANQYQGRSGVLTGQAGRDFVDSMPEASATSITKMQKAAAKKLGRKPSWGAVRSLVKSKFDPHKQVRVQSISATNKQKRYMWACKILTRLGVKRFRFRGKSPGVPGSLRLGDLCFADEKIFRQETSNCPQNYRIWLRKHRRIAKGSWLGSWSPCEMA